MLTDLVLIAAPFLVAAAAAAMGHEIGTLHEQEKEETK